MPAESFLAILQEALSDPVFVVDYKRMYPVVNDIDILQQACSDLDMFKVNFIHQAYTTADEQFLTTTTYPPLSKEKSIPIEYEDEEGAAAWPASKSSPADIQNVLDVLPYLERIVVEKLLERYDNPELVISAVLEGNLPPDLQELQNQPTAVSAAEPSTSKAKKMGNTTKLQELGFGDDDSVIVKRNKGFPGQPKNLQTMLDDKTHVRSLKSRYEEYGLVTENDYDDEYDDSYDALAESEAKGIKNKSAARNVIFNELQDDYDDDTDEDDDSEEESQQDDGKARGAKDDGKGKGASAAGLSSYLDTSKDFCENPELVRERRAQNWNNKMGARAPRKTTKIP